MYSDTDFMLYLFILCLHSDFDFIIIWCFIVDIVLVRNDEKSCSINFDHKQWTIPNWSSTILMTHVVINSYQLFTPPMPCG